MATAKKKATKKAAPKKTAFQTKSTLRFTGRVDEAAIRAQVSTFVDENQRHQALKAIDDSKRVQEIMSPPGTLNLPPKLEDARLRFGISDGAFDVRATFSRVFVHQIGDDNVLSADPKTGLYMPISMAKDDVKRSPRAVLVSAGLTAMDCLISHGIELGDVVSILELAPWSILVDRIGSLNLYLLVLDVGDISGSMDAAYRERVGEAEAVYDEEVGAMMYRDKNGTTWKPQVRRSRGDM